MISTLRVTTVLSNRIAVSILLLFLGRQALAQADPLEQAIRNYVIDSETADFFRTIIAGVPPQFRDTYAQSLTDAIERVAKGKRDGRRILSQESPLRVTLQAHDMIVRFADDATKQRVAAVWYKYGKRTKAATDALEASGAGKVDGFLVVVIDAIKAAPAEGDSPSPAPAKPDAMQQAIAGIMNPMQQSQARQVLGRMDPEVRQALERILAETARHYQTSPVPFARGLLIGLTAELNRAPGFPSAGDGLEGAVQFIKFCATFADSLDSLASSVNAITRHSSTYADVDWKAALTQYGRDRKSPYLEANLQKMLAESLRSSISQAHLPSSNTPR